MKLFAALSLLLSSHAHALSCNPGLFLLNGGCAECVVGTYKDVFGDGPCTPCPTVLTTAGSGAVAITDCNVCINGYIAAMGQSTANGNPVCLNCMTEAEGRIEMSDECVCPEDTYGAPVTSADIGSYDGPGCTACPFDRETTGDGATTVDQCLCPAGKKFASGGDVDDQCADCDVGEFSTGFSSSCVSCDGGETTDLPGSSSSDDCVCIPGMFLTMGVCQDCAVGTFKANSGDEACEPCPLGTYEGFAGSTGCNTCPPGSTTVATGTIDEINCVCDENFEGNGPFNCEPCPPGEIAAVGNDFACEATDAPTDGPTTSPTSAPTDGPTMSPTDGPTMSPTDSPVDSPPVVSPTDSPVASDPEDDDDIDFGSIIDAIFFCF